MMAVTLHTPVRMCLVCRTRRPKVELIRWVEQAGRWQIDENQLLSGRGRYSCHGSCEQRLSGGVSHG